MLCRGFKILWNDRPLLEILGGGPDNLEHSPRLYESETATAMGIPFNAQWYSLEKETREHHIASRLARIAIDNLLMNDAMRKHG